MPALAVFMHIPQAANRQFVHPNLRFWVFDFLRWLYYILPSQTGGTPRFIRINQLYLPFKSLIHDGFL